ncbi:MAG TPA: sensor domain-containing protein, partial [Actinomycetes bacterium]|nr:sensor domain-containing protein [Actinomycetes bacterium]
MTVEQVATGGPGGWTVGRVLEPLRQVRTLTATIYLLLSMFVGLTWHVILATGLALGVGTLIIWVGVFVLALTLLAWRGGAWLERRWVGAMLGVHIPDPYRPLPDGSLWRRARVLASDPATWKDLAYLVVLFPLGLIWFVVTITVWSLALGLLTAPLWYWIPADGGVALFQNGDRSYLVLDTLPEAILAGVVGALLTVAAAWVVRGMATAHGAVALALLGPSQNQLQARVEALQSSRDRAVDSAEAERRRIERDLHDGAQQRLVALAMDLGMARAKLETDPAAATALVGEAHEEAKRALAELRDLA